VASDLILARQAQPGWAAQSVRQRLRIIRRVRHLVAEQALSLAQTVASVTQRSPAETLVAEILPLADACRFLEREAMRLLKPQRLSAWSRPFWLTGIKAEIHREPLGVVLLIAPSNYPLFLAGVQLLQALTAGNAVLLKPGDGTSAAAMALTRICGAAGLDPRLLRVLSEPAAIVQEAIAAGVDKVVLTGKAATGAAVLAELAPRLTPATLELSGCDAAFVREDADVDLAANALQYSLRLNGGATCIAPRRVFVARALADALATRLASFVQQLPPSPIAPATFSRVQHLVAEACGQGARRLTGTYCPHGAMTAAMTPIIVADAEPAMRLLQEDVFAPVLALVPVDDDAEALRAANGCPYALGATIFGQADTARRLAQHVRAGVVVINDVIVPTADPRLPFGGRGHSGYGVTRGAAGLLELTAIKAITMRSGRWRPHYEPLQLGDESLFQTYIAAVHAASWWQRAMAWVACGRALMARSRRGPHAHTKDQSCA
jgi:acyl-CoA reductase-like NAD-dependent aldehyde dehydrogenase